MLRQGRSTRSPRQDCDGASKHGTEAGFTLVEVLVALTLVAVLFTVLLVTVSVGQRKALEAAQDTGAVAWVQGAMELAIAAGVDKLPPAGRYDAVQVLAGITALPPEFSRATLVVRVVPVKPVLKDVTIEIYGRTETGPAFALSTFVGPRPGP